MMNQKRVAAIHDLSCFGKCSLTVVLPILSAAGVECCPVPTAMLSTHTGGFKDIFIHDLTDDIQPVQKHWESIDLHFDALYSGYLGSFRQLDLVSEFFDKFKSEDTLIVVDPVMADNGKLYGGFSQDFPQGMKKLCAKADIITPNFTEAVLMLGEEYKEGPYDKAYVENLLGKLSELGAKTVVLTGVYFGENELGAAVCDCASGKIDYAFSPWIKGYYHGTGDIFTSVFLSAVLNGKSNSEAIAHATDFVSGCVNNTKNNYEYMWYGVNFEAQLPSMIKKLELE